MTDSLLIQSNDDGTFSIYSLFSHEIKATCKTYRTAVIVGHCIAEATTARCYF